MLTKRSRRCRSGGDERISRDDSAGGGTRHLESAPDFHLDRICADGRFAERDPDSEEPWLYTDDGSRELGAA
jgi:hypothetical protein